MRNNGNGDNVDEKRNSWFTILFNEYNSNKFKYITKNLNMRLSFFSMTKLNNIVKAHKDMDPKLSKKNIDYKIRCKDCNSTYVR